jgi:flavin reductase (DIM6/NTAB) family NADH-FMN oxidoreductase RutF
VLWSLAKKSWSLPAFQSTRHFCIHVLAHDQQAVSDRFAKAGEDKFAGLDIGQGLGGVPCCPAAWRSSSAPWNTATRAGTTSS